MLGFQDLVNSSEPCSSSSQPTSTYKSLETPRPEEFYNQPPTPLFYNPPTPNFTDFWTFPEEDESTISIPPPIPVVQEKKTLLPTPPPKQDIPQKKSPLLPTPAPVKPVKTLPSTPDKKTPLPSTPDKKTPLPSTPHKKTPLPQTVKKTDKKTSRKADQKKIEKTKSRIEIKTEQLFHPGLFKTKESVKTAIHQVKSPEVIFKKPAIPAPRKPTTSKLPKIPKKKLYWDERDPPLILHPDPEEYYKMYRRRLVY